MSCEFQLTATLEGIKKFLDEDSDDEYDSSKKTLQSFKIAVSPTGEIVAFAKATWLLICGSKWDYSGADGAKIKYSPKWHGHLNCKPGEEITSVFCLPFISQNQSSLGCADWTCIILGFSSGCIRFYTEAMQELACSILHKEVITDIKCFCPTPVQQGKHQGLENSGIYVLYRTVICIINKPQLVQTLQNKRNDFIKNLIGNKCETESYLPIDFKKYSFVGQEEVTDACFLGQIDVSSFNTFDHLVTASVIGGFNSNYRASPPQTSLIVTSGRRPFVGFHYTLEGGSSSVLTDVALTVASKIKDSVASTLLDWWSFRDKKNSHCEKPKEVSQDSAERLSYRFGLCDLRRLGESIIVSPDGMFSAVADSFGRVTLIDNTSGVAQQLWKGYRNAQCGFLQVQEDVKKLRKTKGNSPNPQQRQGLFIIIYAPKKNLIEIFTTQNGRRVTTFKVTKPGRLIYTPGLQSSPSISAGGCSLSHSQVIFISEDGFRNFSIPFHCALEEDNSKISRDLHVLKKMKMLLKVESTLDNSKFLEDIEKCAQELKTDEVRLQAIESMITYRNVTFETFKTILKVFLEALQNKERNEPAPMKIIKFAKTTYNFVLLFEFLINLQSLTPKVDDTTVLITALSEELRLPQNELDIILKFIQQITEIEKSKQRVVKVAFKNNKSTKLIQFLSFFDFESFLNTLDKNDKEEELKESRGLILNLKKNRKENDYSYLGEVLFKGAFDSNCSFNEWKAYLKNCCLNPKDLILCLILYWCEKEVVDDIFREVLFFIEVLKFICSLNDPDTIVVEYNTESPWWQEIRSFIAGNPFTVRGLFAALCCRSVTIFVEQERELSLKQVIEKKQRASEVSSIDNTNNSETTTFNNDWETLSKDSCQWDILIMQLQDVALLNAILNLTFKTQSNLPEVPFDFERESLASIQAKGLGRVSELVAKWLVQFGFEPSALIDKNDLEFQIATDGKEVEKERSELIFAIDKANEINNDKNANRTLEYLGLLKSRFPYSLTSSSLVSNMCWEYFAYCFKNLNDLDYLRAAVRYLESIPVCRIKYGIGYLSWNLYLEPKFETLAKMINRIGKVPRDKLCVQEIGLRNDQVPLFLQIICEILNIILFTDAEDKPDIGSNREAIWQSSSTSTTLGLVSVALSQPVVNADLVSFQLQLCYSLLMMSSLNIKQQKVFSFLFDNMEKSSFLQSRAPQSSSHYQNLKLKDSRSEFLKKCISAAVQTIEIVENIPLMSADECVDVVPATKFEVESYKKWLHLCFELAGMWTVALDGLRKHQILELYAGGFDRLAEEVIPSVNDTSVLASQLLVLGGKRLKYFIQNSDNLSKISTKLSANLSEWLHTLDLGNFTHHGTTDDIEVLMRYTAKWLPEDHSDQKLAVAIIESLSFLKATNY